jgi:hypothetical protein
MSAEVVLVEVLEAAEELRGIWAPSGEIPAEAAAAAAAAALAAVAAVFEAPAYVACWDK